MPSEEEYFVSQISSAYWQKGVLVAVFLVWFFFGQVGPNQPGFRLLRRLWPYWGGRWWPWWDTPPTADGTAAVVDAAVRAAVREGMKALETQLATRREEEDDASLGRIGLLEKRVATLELELELARSGCQRRPMVTAGVGTPVHADAATGTEAEGPNRLPERPGRAGNSDSQASGPKGKGTAKPPFRVGGR